MPNLDLAEDKNPQKILVSNKLSKPGQPQSISLTGLKTKKQPRRWLRFFFSAIILVILLLGATVLLKASNLTQKIFVGQKTTFFGQLVDLLRGSPSEQLQENDSGQINILLLGIGGEGHDGPYLTDTMILAQVRPDLGEITLTSIPRDYLATMPDGSDQKINAAFALGFGKDKDWSKAGEWSRQTVEKISGLDVPYFAVIDFSGFEKAVDKIGGLDLTVDRTFTDYQYPDNGVGYLPAQTFQAGSQHMNGTRALIYARSRHAEGIEGSDFARGVRQQKIIEAFKQKVFALNIIKDSGTLNDLLNIFADHFHTNLSPSQLLSLYNVVKEKNMQTLSLSVDLESHLVCNEILASNGAYVLVPCRSAEDIQNFFKNSFAAGKIKQEQATVWLATSTGDKQAYNYAFRELTDAGVNVLDLPYSKDYLDSTVVYQVNPKPGTLEFIKNSLAATEAKTPPPGVTINSNKVDIIIVLGQNAVTAPTPIPYISPPAMSENTSSTTSSTSTTPLLLTPTTGSSKK